MRFSRLDKYIFMQSLYGFGLAIIGVSVSIIMVDLVEQMRAISGLPNSNILTALWLTIIRLPSLIEQTIPIAMLLGAIIAFSRLSRKSEIIAMRAAGVSAWRFLAPLAYLSALIGVFVILILSPSASILNKKYENVKQNLTSSLQTQGQGHTSINWVSIPIKNGQIIFTGQKISSNANLSKYASSSIFKYDSDGIKLLATIDAKSAIKTQNTLQLFDAQLTTPGEKPILYKDYKIHLLGEGKSNNDIDARSLAIWELPQAAIISDVNGGSASRYWLRFFRLIALPITIVAMSIFAATMCLGLDRSGGKTKAIFIAIAIGIIMYFSNDVAGLLAGSGRVPSLLAAFGPPIFALSLTLAFLSFKEDGQV